MNVRLIFRHIEHHAGRSGYDQLARFVQARPYRPGLLYRLARKMPESFIQRIKAFNSQWYRREALFTELEIMGRMAAPVRRLYHFLYGEDNFRLSGGMRLRWNNRILASFHQPPEVFEELFPDKRFLRGLSGVVTLCGEQEAYFQRFLPAARVFRVPHGVDVDYWRPDPGAPRRAQPTFLTVGWWLRDIDLLKAAIAKVHAANPDVRFRIVTFPHLFEHFAGLPAAELLAGIPDEQLLEEYRTCTALFLPLKAVTANNAVLETMACGTGVISTDKGGLPDYVDDECAVKLPPGDADAAAGALLALAADPGRAAAMGRAARTRALLFDWRVVAERMDYVYRRVLGLSAAPFYHASERRPRNVCLLTEEYPPESGWGGIATHNFNLARGLARAGHRVFVIAGGWEGAAVRREPGIEVHRVRFDPRKPWQRRLYKGLIGPFLARRYPEFQRRLEFGLAARKKLRTLLLSEPLHVIETPEYYGSGYFARRLPCPCPLVVKLHTPTELNCLLNSLPVPRDVKLASRLEKGSALRAHGVISPSQKMIDTARRLWLPALPPTAVVENPIDTELYRPDPQAPGGRAPFFLFSGRLEFRKGVQVLLPAFAKAAPRIPGFELHLAGHDTPTFALDGKVLYFREYVEKMDIPAELRARIRFLGRQGRDDLIRLYQSAYACVIPSTSFENFPYSCLEAMACGKAVIVTDSGGMTEMAPADRCGLHVKAGDADALAGALIRLALDPEAAERMGAAARRIVLERYSMEKMTEKALAYYENLISRERYR